MQDRQDLISEIGSGFERLVGQLAAGNLKKAKRQARKALAKNHGVWAASLGLIEDEADEQAIKSALINLPSVVPGIGTLIAFVMMGAADFLILDDCIRLILSLRIVYGLPVDGQDENRERVMRVLSQALALDDTKPAGQTLVGQVMPERYVSAFMNRGLTKVLSRLTGRRGLKLLPAGIGVAVSAYGGQSAVRSIGAAALEQIHAELELKEPS